MKELFAIIGICVIVNLVIVVVKWSVIEGMRKREINKIVNKYKKRRK